MIADENSRGVRTLIQNYVGRAASSDHAVRRLEPDHLKAILLQL